MFYRILSVPPGYGPDRQYLIAAYETLDYDSCQGSPSGKKEVLWAKTIEEARAHIPEGAERLPWVRQYQFIELWKHAEV